MNTEEISSVDETTEAPPIVPRKRKKKKWPIILLLLIIIGGVVFFFRKPILNGLRKVPVIGKILPIPEESQEPELSTEELKVKVKSQEKEIEQLNAKLTEMESEKQAMTEKNKSLSQYETMYNDFMNQKAAWDEQVARTNKDLFIKQFESVYPDVAQEIYKTLKGEQILSDKQKELSNTIGQMDEEQAAAALEKLISTDSELIQSIFEGMGTDQRALILSAMQPGSAAQVIKLISPDE